VSAGAPVYGVLGALAAFPRRLAAREVERRGARLRRGVDRATTHVVIGAGLIDVGHDAAVAARVAAERAAGRTLLSEAGFLRALALAAPASGDGLDAAALLARSRLPAEAFELLRLFDAFESPEAPFTLRDVILAKKYAGLLAEGAGWGDVARSLRRARRDALPAATLARCAERGAILARDDARLRELDGQYLLGIEGPAETPDALFAAAEAAEAAGRAAEAAALYARCLALDPGDATAAFNRANCLRADGRDAEAEAELARALKHDPAFVEAWFNLSGLARARGRTEAARAHLARALAIDPDFADAVYNLATLEFEAGDLAAAGRWWRRYLELDADSDWARTAARGLRFVATRA
jgi:tetratricopeptide (TPR) repeat protein